MPLIKIEIHRHYHYFDRQEFQNMSRQLDALVEEVAALRGVVDGHIATSASQLRYVREDGIGNPIHDFNAGRSPAALCAVVHDLRFNQLHVCFLDWHIEPIGLG